MAGALGVALTLVGTGVQYVSQQRMINEQTKASKRAENAREQQMQLDAQRRRRQAVREALVARSMSLTLGTNQGAQYGSGVASATGGAIAQGAENVQGINSGEILGSRIFAANRDYFEATRRGQMGMAIGQGISALGGVLTSNAGTIEKLGQNMQGSNPSPQYQTFGNSAPKVAPIPAPYPNFRRGFGYAGNGG